MSEDQANLDRPYWVALSQVDRIGPVRVRRLFEHFGSLEAAWSANRAQLGYILDARSIENIEQARRRTEPAAALELCERLGITVLTAIDLGYPRLLSHIPAAPPVLYVRGSLIETDDCAVAIVGTRRATPYGREIVSEIARDLAVAGVTVVSGLARGIDGFAHQGALEGQGRTVAVMASGVDVIYPSEHRALADRVAGHGALVSDYPPGTKPDGSNFPARNRIIAGMSLATVVVEAPARSGALITVDFAADQGRDVFVVPANVTSGASTGSNKLIRDGARMITSAADLLMDLGIGELTIDQTAPSQESLPLTDEERRIMAVMSRQPVHVDEIVVAANMTVSQGSAMLTMLELKGLVQNAGSQHYSLTRSSRSANS
ncbi:DNA-processing protein DprA [soil metagenome]